MRGLRPARPLAPTAGGALVLAVWWVVAHNSGSGWVQVLGDAVFGAVAVGLLGPVAALARTRLSVARSPEDATAGLPVAVRLHVSGRVRIRPAEPPGPETMTGPTVRRLPDEDELVLLPTARGLHSRLVLDVATAAPFGLQWWTRRVTVPLAVPLHVAPRRGAPLPLPPSHSDEAGEHSTPVPGPVGEARGARPYEPGDQRRRVHWPATAHAGRLMVRQMEEPSARPTVLRVCLPPGREAAERAAERALGTAAAILDGGARLVMATDEADGPVVAEVADRREAGRRLARATQSAGPPGVEVLR